MPTPVFDKLKNGAATIKEKTKKSVTNAVQNVKKGVEKGAESVKKGMNLAIAKITAPIRRGNKRVKKNAQTEKATRLLSGRNRNGERKEELVPTCSTVRINLLDSFKNKLSGNGTDKQERFYMGYGTFFWLAVVLTSKSNADRKRQIRGAQVFSSIFECVFQRTTTLCLAPACSLLI